MTAQEVPSFIHEIAQRAAAATGARAVYLFGSRARGPARADSDVDLLIVVQDNANLRDTAIAAAEANTIGHMSVDFVPIHENRFVERSSIMAIEASKDGVLLVSNPSAQSPFQTVESQFALQFLRHHQDTSHA